MKIALYIILCLVMVLVSVIFIVTGKAVLKAFRARETFNGVSILIFGLSMSAACVLILYIIFQKI